MGKLSQISFPIFLNLILLSVFLFTVQCVQAQTDTTSLLRKSRNSGAVRIIVQLNDTADSATGDTDTKRKKLKQVRSRLMTKMAGHVQQVKGFQTVPYVAMTVDSAGLQALMEDDDVVLVQEDLPAQPNLKQSLPFIHADSVQSTGYGGSGYSVAILDTGVHKAHEFIGASRVVAEACFSTTATTSSYTSTSLCPDGTDEQIGSGAGENCSTSIDGCSHGTHVAGIAAGRSGDAGNGVAPDAKIISVQIYSLVQSQELCGSDEPCVMAWTSDQIAALEYVYSLRASYKIAAVNMSLGTGVYSGDCDADVRKTMIDKLRSAGIATVVSSGNNEYDGFVTAPACISSAVTVGASWHTSDTVAYYTNLSDTVDLLAPGTSIYSALATGNSSYGTMSGTSMAVSHVSGAFALLKSKYPSWSVSKIETFLKDNGHYISRSGFSKSRIDLEAASLAAATTTRQFPLAAIQLLLNKKKDL